MVNAKFRDRRRYGFEMVDARRHVANRRQSKIYGDFDRRHFSQIVAKLISMQTLALYLGSLVVDRLQWRRRRRETTTGLQDVVPAAIDVLARAGAGAPAAGQDA
jgi:hypothetical protein